MKVRDLFGRPGGDERPVRNLIVDVTEPALPASPPPITAQHPVDVVMMHNRVLRDFLTISDWGLQVTSPVRHLLVRRRRRKRG